GADDNLVKIWSATDSRLLATLRGHTEPITDLAVNYENTLLAAGSCDKMIRVWCMRTTAPICVLVGHTGAITSLNFCPYSRDHNRFLVSTASDGCVCFWKWDAHTNVFEPKAVKFNERTKPSVQLICSSFSGGGAFLAVGSTDHYVRVFHVSAQNGPQKILEIEAHSDQVDSLQFSNIGFRFVSGSKDGTANIWWFERQEWKSHLLNMSEKLPGQPSSDESDLKVKLRVNMVCWTCDDAYVITAVSDHSLKLWDSNTGKLVAIFKAHDDDVFVIEAHPFDPRVFLSGGHDGQIILWDVVQRKKIKTFINQIEGQGQGSIFDCKFSPDGQFIASTDSHGNLTIYGFGSNDRYKKVPKEVFFHTDYRPLIRDSNHYVIDEQTQCAPHLMPPPFLVDIDGNPYEPHYQRLVPGRENCREEQLVPYIAIQNASGVAEVLEPVHRHDEPPPQQLVPPLAAEGDHRPTIDDMIERFQQEQDRNRVNYEHGYAALPAASSSGRLNGASNAVQGRPTEGVRQSSGNWQTRGNNGNNPKRKVVVRPLKSSFFVKLRNQFSKYAEIEEAMFVNELKRKHLVVPKLVEKETLAKERVTRRKRRINQERQGVFSRNTGQSRVSSNRRHVGIIDYENPDDLLTPEESGSNFSGSGADSWEETSSERKDSKTNVKKVKKEKGSSGEEHSKSGSDDENVHNTSDNSDSDGPRTKVGPSGKLKLNCDIKVTKYPEWLIGVVPKRSPYFPQIGDEVIYIRLGHERYLDAVRTMNEYKIHPRTQANKRKHVKDEQLVRITKIEYEFLPPIVVNLTLLVIDEEGKDTSESFIVRYHDMPDVLDFLILKQTYIDAMSKKWQANDRFRSVIDDKWWFGTVTSVLPQKYNSSFQSLKVLWDNNEEEQMSPWDIEPLDDECDIVTGTDGIPVKPDERPEIYSPLPSEWPSHGMEVECQRIIAGLDKIMETSWAEHFNAPVDLNAYPHYVICVPYPIDLNTIRERLESKMYRRLDALKFDVRHIETNAKLFNEPKSDIRLKARIVSDLCTRFIEDTNCEDPSIFIQEITQNKDMLFIVKVDSKKQVSKKIKREITSNTWKQQAKELLDLMYRSADSEPFRFQVDPIQYPDYLTVIDTPMDLSTVREQLLVNDYSNPNEFVKDMNLIFTNSRSFNTNKRSRIYAMTCRLKALFEEKIKPILSDYRCARSMEKKCKRQNTKTVRTAKRKPKKDKREEKRD
ncbi:bromodomain and WD repeat-containing protein 3-like protein, partial [Leptotrombidium deliense]